jgi:ubiquinone/menaquinone biosynthesis C-methylase UbiE
MKAENYDRLSAVYDLDWGDWALQYEPLVCELLKQAGIEEARILDLACGTGGLALNLATHGHTVHGVDISPGMIGVARSKAGDNRRVEFRVGDMVRYTANEEYDCVLCTFDALNYILTPELINATFQGVARVVRSSGYFVFDSITEQLFLNRQKGVIRRVLGGEPLLQKLSYDRESMIATTIFEFADGTEEVHKQRGYGFDEISAALTDAGFEIERAVSGFHNLPHSDRSERIFYIAKREDV